MIPAFIKQIMIAIVPSEWLVKQRWQKQMQILRLRSRKLRATFAQDDSNEVIQA